MGFASGIELSALPEHLTSHQSLVHLRLLCSVFYISFLRFTAYSFGLFKLYQLHYLSCWYFTFDCCNVFSLIKGLLILLWSVQTFLDPCSSFCPFTSIYSQFSFTPLISSNVLL